MFGRIIGTLGLIAAFGLAASVNLNITAIVLLVSLSGLFSGLTLGILGLSLSNLRVEAELGNHYAKSILPIREKGNLILCTLLLSNVVVNSVLAIFLADLTSGLIGALLSVSLITLFGEIIPQSFSIKYGVRMAYYSLPILYFALTILFPVSYPIAKALDKILGHELPTISSKRKLSKIIEHAQKHGIIDKDENKVLYGGITYSDMTVKEVMTPLHKVYMLKTEDVLDKKTLQVIYDEGYSRIPVYKNRRSNIVGILYVKRLIYINPEELHLVKDLMSLDTERILENENLDIALNKFHARRHHLFIVYNDDIRITGIVSLEDIVEEILQADIVDETDDESDIDRNQNA